MKSTKTAFRNFSFVVLIISAIAGLQAQVVQTFSYTGSVQTFTVPVCVNSVTIEAWGAQGGANWTSNTNYGGYAKATFTVSQGMVLNIYVGQQPNGTTGGWNGGGNGEASGQGGGGASDVRIGGTTYSDRVIVAGGGGGAGYWSSQHVVGGVGGGLTGGDGYRSTVTTAGGQGGTQTGSGLGTCVTTNNAAMAGGFGYGGAPSSCGCEGYGGGGGWYGGAASGNCRGGGGGSGYILPAATNGTFSSGVRAGHGEVKLTYDYSGNAVAASLTPTAICNGQTATLSATGMLSYTWSAGANPNSNSITVNPNATTSYTISGTNSLNCVSQSVLTVSVDANVPVITINSSTTQTCPGKAVTLTATGALTHAWSGGISNGVAFTPSVTDSYTVTGSNGCGTSSAAITVTVDPLPVGAVASQTLVCQLETVTLTAAGGTSYSWSPGTQTVSSIIVAPQANTIYTVTASDGTCQGTATVLVNTNPNPTITTTASSSLICAGYPVTITATGADAYTWTPAHITGSTGVVTPTAPTNYMVTGSNAFGCTGNASQIVVTYASPDVFVTASHSLICAGGTLTLSATGTADTYSWSTGDIAATVTLNPTQNNTYTAIGTLTSTGCYSAQVVVVNVFQPTFAVSADASICRGAALTLTTGPATGHLWSDGSTGSSLTVSPSVNTIYSVTATITENNLNCIAANSVAITVLDKPELATDVPRTTICVKETTTLTADGANTYTWNNSFQGPAFVYTAFVNGTRNFTVVGTNSDGCRDTAIVKLFVSTCTGLDGVMNTTGLKIYPNPGSGFFTISAGHALELSITNSVGAEVAHVKLHEGNGFTIHIDHLAKGVYFISSEKYGLIEKLIVGD